MDPHSRLQRRIQAMEMRCYCKILHISYRDHATNEDVRAKIHEAIGPHKDLLTIINRRKLQWYGHVSCSSGPAKTILQRTVKGGRRVSWCFEPSQPQRITLGLREEYKADRGRGGKTTSGNGQAWSLASPRGQWKIGKMEKTGCKIICGAPTTLAVK